MPKSFEGMRHLALVILAALLAACTSPTQPPTGPETPSPIPITANPSALPIGDTVPTSMVIGGQELVLYFWGRPDRPNLDHAWRDTTTGAIDLQIDGLCSAAAEPDDLPRNFFRVRQCTFTHTPLIEYGAVWAAPARITSRDAGKTTNAHYTRWSNNRDVTIFWLKRQGKPIPQSAPYGDGGWGSTPLPEDRYPLLTAYDAEDRTIATARLRPPATEQKG
ncbi:hypothetical protein Val02_49310 [Virgisporangium aliadipatigenens]|uniref:Lipoprotein n=1 Tax=Virgisporangium aliadipatigenens TaxID=741659 RepID=A0A8J3YQA6_9ACTN|nr:hypothetical protein [Virgisporangium aliadipatigenens]GIJ48045.1 hypothetical protein Val02_49310 [Virgisporangium aliadipatigenens]